MSSELTKVVALSGGIGGAKLALGLYRILPSDSLTVIANTGDDFEHFGLSISPDLDTLLYTLSGKDNQELGWGRRGETWTFMAAIAALGGESWFRLGDGDLATHVERTRRLRAGEPLSSIIDDFRRNFGIAARLLPMSNDPVRTKVQTADGPLEFQDYFVRQRCAPVVTALRFAGAETALPSPEVLTILGDPRVGIVVICPSNPFISIDPILAVPGIRTALRDCPAPVVAVSPIIGGKAVKGPTAKMMAELGLPVGAAAVARHYSDLIDLYIADEEDACSLGELPMPVIFTRTLMQSIEDREQLARDVINAAARVRR